MPKICYQHIDFRSGARDIIAKANEIIEEYAAQGLDLTLRQLYYQFVSRDWLPNKTQSYDRLGSIVNDARLAGLIDWDRIQDRTRELRGVTTWTNPESIVNACAQQYKEDLWRTQTVRPEVWIEKDALVGVIERVCEENRVDYFSCRGYTSQSEMWVAGQRLLTRARRDSQRTLILHLGDHDPSGIDMTRDIKDRLNMFAGPGTFTIVRIALTMEQVRQYDPPPNPAKTTDSRYESYQAEYGDESWELDALEPSVLTALIQAGIDGVKDEYVWGPLASREKANRNHLSAVSDHWAEVVNHVQELEDADEDQKMEDDEPMERDDDDDDDKDEDDEE